MSIHPGKTVKFFASKISFASPLIFPISTILPFLIYILDLNNLDPVPSAIKPSVIIKSYVFDVQAVKISTKKKNKFFIIILIFSPFKYIR